MIPRAARFGVYVHFPYCLSKCPYCDFASVVADRIPHRRYAEAVLRELSLRAEEHGRPDGGAESLYFGGGTPSLWEPSCVASVITGVRELFGLSADAEVTLEANPGASEARRFAALREAGVNRLSIGLQSMDERVLAGLGRRHTVHEAESAVRRAREAGFHSVSVDLIFGGPGQDLAGARADAERAVALGPEHLSCYGLTLEGLAEDVRLAKEVRRGRVHVADDSLQSQMGAAVRAVLGGAGYERYEISNYARPGFESRHNTLYWRGHDYAAAGCGAHGYRRTRPGGTRYGNPRKPEAYLDAVERGGVIEAERESISPAQLFEERLFLGLRLASGLDLEAAARDTVGEIPASTLAALPSLESMGLVQREGSHVWCTESGLDFHTEVAVRLLPATPALTIAP